MSADKVFRQKPKGSYRHGDLRAALLREGAELLEHNPASSFTLRHLARRLRVSHAAVYRHFSSKDSLLTELACAGFASLSGALASAASSGGNAETQFVGLGVAYLRCALDRPAQFRCMFAVADRAPDEAARITTAAAEAQRWLLDVVGRLERESGLGGADPRDVGVALWSMLHGLASLVLDEQLCQLTGQSRAQEFEAMAARITRLLLIGVAAPVSGRAGIG